MTQFLITAAFVMFIIVVAVVNFFWQLRTRRQTAAPIEGERSDDENLAVTNPTGSGSNAQSDTIARASPTSDRITLTGMTSWAYQLQDLNVSAAAASPFDLLVIDHGAGDGVDPLLSRAQIVKLKTKPDGSRRAVVAYLSVGEAESYRSYWKKSWKPGSPRWLLGENPDWDENYAVKFWHLGWQSLIFGSKVAYLDQIIAQGFDGVYLDKCDLYEDLERDYRSVAAKRKNLEGDMITFIERLSRYARDKSPGFVIIMQNAEGLLRHKKLRAVIDAAAKEELVFGQDGGEIRNQDDDYQYSQHHLGLLKKAGKPVFVVEYLTNNKKIRTAQRIARELGFVLTIAQPDRELAQLNDPLHKLA